MRIVTAEQMRQMDRDAAAHGLPTAILMANAGRAVAEATRGAVGDLADKSVLVLVGPGNNGGDGLVAASHLRDWGAIVTLYLWNRQTEGDDNFEETQQRGIPALTAAEDAGFADLREAASKADIVVDALLGTGKARAIGGVLKGLLETVEQAKRVSSVTGDASPRRPSTVAVDLPTGLDADSGAVDPATLRADVTVTLGLPKAGLFLLPGAEYVGRLIVADIGFPPEPEGTSPLEMLTAALVRRHLPARPAVSHKGTYGKALVVAGSKNYVGAPYLACMGAGRVGAGLVTLACAETIYPILAGKLVEATFLPLPEAAPGALGTEAVEALCQSLPDYDVVLLGPGLGQHPATLSFVEQTLRWVRHVRTGEFDHLSWVLDADGLNALARVAHWPEAVPERAILTPHPAEMARLLNCSVGEIQSDRLGAARRAADEWRRAVVLKGANTIIAAPDGQTFVNPSANPALATAGTGDVLAGAIAGFLTQGLDPKWGAVAGVFVHGQAGEIARDLIGDAGALAGDLLDLLPEAIGRVKE